MAKLDKTTFVAQPGVGETVVPKWKKGSVLHGRPIFSSQVQIVNPQPTQPGTLYLSFSWRSQCPCTLNQPATRTYSAHMKSNIPICNEPLSARETGWAAQRIISHESAAHHNAAVREKSPRPPRSLCSPAQGHRKRLSFPKRKAGKKWRATYGDIACLKADTASSSRPAAKCAVYPMH